MKELLEKLSSYNIFNYLLPGIIFVYFADTLTNLHIIQKDIFLGVFLYYFIGLFISRIGSLIIEPFLQKIKFIQFLSYADFVSASKKDKFLEIFSETNNMYRTFCSLFMSLIFLKIYERLSNVLTIIKKSSIELLVIGLLIIFIFSYRKQTQYIKKRIQYSRRRG